MSSVKLRKKAKIPKLAANGAQAAVLQAVRDHAPISRSAIARRTGMQLPAVSRTVSPLLEKGVLLETPRADASGARRKRGLSLNPEAGHCLSVAYDASGIEGVVVDAAYGVCIRDSLQEPLDRLPRQKKMEKIASFIRALQSRVPAATGPCLALALVDPGVIDEESGRVLLSSTMDDWHDVPVVDILQAALGLPIMLLKTSMSTIRAVDQLELRGLSDNLAYIEYHEGIGCGLKLEGKYVSGQLNLAGEFGHVRVTDDPVTCRCGAVGCLEAVAAMPALARKAQVAVSEGSRSSLAGRPATDGLGVLTAASRGDRLASRIVEEAFGYLGRAVGGLVNMLAPEIVVFDSVIAKAGEEAVGALLQTVRASVLPTHLRHLDLRVSALESHTNALGGAVAVLNYCIEY